MFEINQSPQFLMIIIKMSYSKVKSYQASEISFSMFIFKKGF